MDLCPSLPKRTLSLGQVPNILHPCEGKLWNCFTQTRKFLRTHGNLKYVNSRSSHRSTESDCTLTKGNLLKDVTQPRRTPLIYPQSDVIAVIMHDGRKRNSEGEIYLRSHSKPIPNQPSLNNHLL